MGKVSINALRRELAGLHDQSAAWAHVLFLGALVMYIVCFLGAAFLNSIYARIACSLALGPLIALLFRIAHDAGHHSHFASRQLNWIAGNISILPSYHPYSVWLYFHNARHHTFTNLRSGDYVWIPRSKGEYDRLSMTGRALERCYRTMLGVGIYYLYAIWFKTMMFPPRTGVRRPRPEFTRDSVIVLIFFFSQVLLLSWGVNGPGELVLRFALAILMPFAIFNWLVGFASFLNHTHPQVPWFSRRREWSYYTGQVNCTVHMTVPAWMVFFLTDVGLHGVHHIDPRIPIWGLDRAQSRIVSDTQADIVFDHWSYARHREILRCCKLYDYESHTWIGFDGRPTTPKIFAQPSALSDAAE